MAQKAKVTAWCGLLAETRLALSTLRQDDLEKLAARAEKMVEATTGHDADPLVNLEFGQGERSRVTKEYRLLGSLLAATGKNLEILQRLRGNSPRPNIAGEMDSRWVR
jgi:hypothetical protein